MLRSIRDITNSYKLLAIDGEIGKIKDFYFNDMLWHIRYLVADTGDWLHERLVLISPAALGKPDWASETLPVNSQSFQNIMPGLWAIRMDLIKQILLIWNLWQNV